MKEKRDVLECNMFNKMEFSYGGKMFEERGRYYFKEKLYLKIEILF